MLHWFRHGGRGNAKRPRHGRPFRPAVEGLEDRCLLAGGPTIDPIQVPLNIPSEGKTLIIPITANDPSGGTITYSLTSNNMSLVTVTTHAVSATNPILQITTNLGVMEFELFGDLTPSAVNFIAGMAKSGFYNGLIFHRVVKGFVIQGGDPAGNGSGGPGFTFDDEFNQNAIYSGTGQLAMANTGPDTNGSQFFVTVGTQRGLDFNNEIFGQLVRGFDVLQTIDNVPVDGNSKPITPVTMTNVAIIQDATVECFTLQSVAGASPGSTTLTLTATSSNGGSTQETLNAQVVADATNDPPTLDPVTNQVSTSGSAITIHVTRTDLENDASTFLAQVATADQANATVSMTASTNGSADFLVTPTSGFTGSIHLTIGVEEQGATSRGNTQPSSGNPFALFDTQQIVVAFGDKALAPGTAPIVSATEGAAPANFSLGSFTDQDTAATAGQFTVAINWGDGTPTDTTSGQVSGSAGNFNVSGTHTYKEAGKFAVKVVITDAPPSGTGSDKGGATATLTGTATVADAALQGQGATISTSQMSAFNGTVATFTDANTAAKTTDFTASINWGDNTPATTGVISGSAGNFTVTGSHTFATPGAFVPKVTITDVNTAGDATPATATASGTATVTSASATQRFVNQVFHNILGRDADNGALSYFGGLLDLGLVTRFQVTLAVEDSLEHRLGQVNQAYFKFIGRLPDQVTLVFLVDYLGSGGTVAGLEVVLANTPEYFQSHGGGTNRSFVQSLFQDGLNRSAEDAAVTQFTKMLDSGVSRDQVAAIVFNSQEAQLNSIQNQFQTFLKHGADINAANSFLHLFQQDGNHDELMVALIGGSPEFSLDV
jgi:cyclophilin family peptidyl-prolyl cis-trans isomerase